MTTNKKLLTWVEEWKQLCQPDSVHWCDGSEEENQRLLDEMVASGAAKQLNEEKQPASYSFNSDPSDVARVENRSDPPRDHVGPHLGGTALSGHHSR